MAQQNIIELSFKKIKEYIEGEAKNEHLLVHLKNPSELKELIDFSIPNKGVSEEEFLGFIDQYLKYSVKTGHSQFVNQLYSGFNLPAFLGELFTVLTNTSMYTYEVAPVATMIEKEMVELMNSYTGFSSGDGIFVTGGSNGNLVAMFSARNRLLPNGKFEGYDSNLKLRAFVNEQAHYSFETAANIMGLGSQAVIKVKADMDGRMIPEELVRELKSSVDRGEKPFFVAATCATTLLGAYDPIDEICGISKPYGMWVHVDGSFGGSLILSDAHSHFFKGLDQTDSFVWNPHKLMNIPLVCSVLLVRNKDTFTNNLTDLCTDYLFHEQDDLEDLGKKSIQCGRRVDAVKLWFAWKYYGKEGYRDRICHSFKMAEYAEKVIQFEPRLELLAERQSFTLCFRYQPENHKDLDGFNLALREELKKSGLSMVNYGYHNGSLVLRLIFANAQIETSDVDQFFSNLLQTALMLDSKQS